MADLRTSVALATYQAERFVDQQLTSIAAQSRPPDELVVCDDGSTDATLQLLRRFKDRVSMPVHLVQNGTRLGPTQNVAKAIALCTGDIVFPADPDDVWHPAKVERLTSVLTARPQAGLVFSDAEVVNEYLQPMRDSLWRRARFGWRMQRRVATGRAFHVMVKQIVGFGGTMAFRSRFRDLILPVPDEWLVDAWIGLLIAAVADAVPISERLVKYRQHGDQYVGTPSRRLGEAVRQKRATQGVAYRDLAERHRQALRRLRERAGSFPSRPEVFKQLEGKIEHFLTRARMRTDKSRLRMLAGEALAGGYHRYSSGWRSLAVDLFLR